jgi:hypothetical protein
VRSIAIRSSFLDFAKGLRSARLIAFTRAADKPTANFGRDHERAVNAGAMPQLSTRRIQFEAPHQHRFSGAVLTMNLTVGRVDKTSIVSGT